MSKRILLLLILAACGSPEEKIPLPPTIPMPKESPKLKRQSVMPPMPPSLPEQGPGSVTLCWDKNPEPNIWYIAHRSMVPGAVKNSLDQKVTQTNTVKFENLVVGRAHFFQVVARNDHGDESAPSLEIGYIQPRLLIRAGSGRIFIRFKRPVDRGNVEYVLERSMDFSSGSWKPVVSLERIVSVADGLEVVEAETLNEENYRFFRVHVVPSKEGCNE